MRPGGRTKYTGICSICGTPKTSRWYIKAIPDKVICSSCYGRHRRDTDPAHKEKRLKQNREWNKTFNGAVKTARQKGMPFTLTKDEWESKTQSCHYCKAFIGNKGGVRLDRVDNSLSYTPNNTVGCCRICNIAKNNMTLSEFKIWITNVYNNFLLNN